MGHRRHLHQGPRAPAGWPRCRAGWPPGSTARRSRSARSAARSSVRASPSTDLDPGRLDDGAQHGDQVAVRLDRHHPWPRSRPGPGSASPGPPRSRAPGSRARRPRGGRCAGPCWGQRRSSARGPGWAAARAPTAAGRCRRRNGSPGDCDVHHSLARGRRSARSPRATGRPPAGSPPPRGRRPCTTVDAPVALFTTVSTVPNGSVGLAHIPGGAAEYHVASPPSLFVGRRRAAARSSSSSVAAAAVVAASSSWSSVGGAVVVVVGAARRRRGRRRRGRRRRGRRLVRDEVRRQVHAVEMRRRVHGASRAVRARRAPRPETATRAPIAFCNKRRGAPNNAPQMTAATPRRLPPVLWFRRAPPFSGDTVHPRRHTGGEGFLENLDNQSRAAQTRNRTKPFRALISPGHETVRPRYLDELPVQRAFFARIQRSNTQVTRFSYYAQQRVI